MSIGTLTLSADDGTTGSPVVMLLSDSECWNRLPETVSGSGQPLPSWARAVAVHLPRTTAAMLKLDFAHRTMSPVDPVLRAKMRWVIADANHCDCSKAYAIADLQRAGATDEVIRILTGAPNAWPDADRQPLGLQLPLDEHGPLGPIDVEFAEGALQIASLIPPHGELPSLRAAGEDVIPDDADWAAISFDELQTRLEQQRDRKPRLPVPSWDEVKRKLPPAMASNDWSAFPAEEQRAYAYARKLSRAPWTLTAEDYRTLEQDLGPAKAMSTFWWLCRGLYMTRISDGFQLPLERENVFGNH